MAELTQPTITKPSSAPKESENKPTPIGRLPIAEVDAGLADCEKVIKSHSDTVKAKLAGNAAIPANVLRELSRANAQKAKLIMRRITLLIESGDSAAMELVDKLVKLKAPKAS